MPRVFEDDEDERAPRAADRELTLGMGTLLMLFFALVLVCGLCFGVGFSLGERSATAKAALSEGTQSAASLGTSSTMAGSGAKPSPVASGQATAGVQPVVVPDDLTAAPESGANPQGVSGQATGQAAASQQAVQQAEQLANGAAGGGVTGVGSGGASVHAALPQSGAAMQSGNGGVVHAALPTGNGAAASTAAVAGQFLVQVAAVSDPVDAQVLLDALKKRGYAVRLAHATTDSLMHVQVGPFATRAEALATRQRLLHDGYNAIVK